MKRKLGIVCGIFIIILTVMLCMYGVKKRDTGAEPMQPAEEYTDVIAIIEPDVSDNSESTEESTEELTEEITLTFTAKGGAAFDSDKAFYDKNLKISVVVPEGCRVFYSLDGLKPDNTSALYEEPLVLEVRDDTFSDAYSFKAVAELEDGSYSRVAARTFFVMKEIADRFTTMVICVSGNPSELTEEPDGIFYGENYRARGLGSEREVYVEARNPDDTIAFEQFAGVRIKGGGSRKNEIKGMRLFARKEYDPLHKKFRFSGFNTPKEDGSNDIIDSYFRICLRPGGTDWNEAYIRDEVCQTLARQAGMECTESVLPVSVYLNGAYYCFAWLHEDWCNDLLKEKYGDASGKFYKIEGAELNKKNQDEDRIVSELAEEYCKTYDELIKLDMKQDKNYRRFCDFIDIEDYLQSFAFNLFVNNFDWPGNNYRQYKYVGEPDETVIDPETGELKNKVYDGKWRYIYMDMDYSMGRHETTGLKASFNTFSLLSDETTKTYSPMFLHLMERKDCRNYFRSKIIEYANTVCTQENITKVYYDLHESRADELNAFFEYGMKMFGNYFFSSQEDYSRCEKEILDFASDRAKYMLQYLDEMFPEL